MQEVPSNAAVLLIYVNPFYRAQHISRANVSQRPLASVIVFGAAGETQPTDEPSVCHGGVSSPAAA